MDKEKKRICSKCGKEYVGYPALSRVDNETEICTECGMKEAIQAQIKRFNERKIEPNIKYLSKKNKAKKPNNEQIWVRCPTKGCKNKLFRYKGEMDDELEIEVKCHSCKKIIVVKKGKGEVVK